MAKLVFMLCLSLATATQLSKDLPNDPVNSHNIFNDIVRTFYNSKATTNVVELLNKNRRAKIDEVLQAFNDGVGFKLITIKNGYVQADLGLFDRSLAQLDSIIPQQASQMRSAIDGIHKIAAGEFAASLTKPLVSSRAVQKSMMSLVASTTCSSLTSTVSKMWADYSGRIFSAWTSVVDRIGGTNPIVNFMDQLGTVFKTLNDDIATQATSFFAETCVKQISSLRKRRDVSENDLNRISDISVQNRSYSVTDQFFKLIISIIYLAIVYVVIVVFGLTLYGMNVLVGPLALFFTVFQ